LPRTDRRRSRLIRLGASALLIAGASAIIGERFVQRRAFLGSSPDWKAAKAAFRDQRAALIDDSLDLGASYGHNEVVYSGLVPLRRLSFDAAFSDDSYLIALFDVDSTGFSGVRISRSPLFDSVYFEASPEGRFQRKEALPIRPMLVGEKVRFRIELGRSEVGVFQDDVLLRSIRARTKPMQGFGFRNGERSVVVGSVAVELGDGSSFQLPFRERRSPWPVAAAAFVVLAAILAFVARLTGREIAPALGIFLLSASFLVADREFLSRAPLEPRDYTRPRYYPGLHLDRGEALANGHFRDFSVPGEGIRRFHGKMASKDPYRILFVGSSQVSGEGASRPEERWTERFLENLRIRFGRRKRIEADQVAWARASAKDLIAPFRSHEFDLAIVDLSNFDHDRLDFLRSLESMVSMAQGKDADLLFILEAGSIEVDDRFLRLKHQTMLGVASGNGIPVFDLHFRLSARAGYDSGLIWRDYFNLTSYGQKLFSDALTEYFLNLIRSRGR
jgi:hypothetical protein